MAVAKLYQADLDAILARRHDNGADLWATPDGYPDTIEAWGSALLLRWVFASALFDGALSGITVDAPGLLAAAGGNARSGGDGLALNVYEYLAGFGQGRAILPAKQSPSQSVLAQAQENLASR